MRIGYALCADAAEFSAEGRLSLIGGDYDTIVAAAFPTVRPQMSVVLKLWLTPEECGPEHILRIVLTGPDGARVGEMDQAPFRAQLPRHQARPEVGMGIAATLQGVFFPGPGLYEFHILVDDDEMATVPLLLVLQAQPEPEPEPALVAGGHQRTDGGGAA